MLLLVVYSAIWEPCDLFLASERCRTILTAGTTCIVVCDCCGWCGHRSLNGAACPTRYKAAFLPGNEGFYQYLVDSCYWLDLLLAFSTGYLRDGYEVGRRFQH
jgi:hypothetical protein